MDCGCGLIRRCTGGGAPPVSRHLSSGMTRDPLTPERRSQVMSRVRQKDTKPELKLRRALWAADVRGWRCHVRGICGVPDLCWAGRRIAVFVDSAWWHGHASRWKPGRLPKHWDDKISRNRERDKEVTATLESEG